MTTIDGSLLTSIRVLVVDDDDDERDMLSLALGCHDAEVRAVASADEALEVLSAWTPHVLLSDTALPEMDGCDLIAEVRRRDPSAARLSAVAMTGWSCACDRQQVLGAGFQACLTKPVPLETLVSVVADLARGADGSEGPLADAGAPER